MTNKRETLLCDTVLLALGQSADLSLLPEGWELGNGRLFRDGQPLPLPASRKLRALFAFLALAPRPQGRSQLCELLWEGPSDPRGELRWCLSRIRSAVCD